MKVIGRLANITRDGNKVRLYLRTANGKVKVLVEDFYPYFYVPDPSGEYVAIDGAHVKRVYVNDPSEVPAKRSKYPKHYEADIPYVRRFLIDTGIRGCVDVPSLVVSWRSLKPVECPGDIKLRYWFIDIEVQADTLPNPENPEYPIHAVTIYDTYVGKYFTLVNAGSEGSEERGDWVIVYYDSENKLLNDLIKAANLAEPDVLVAWNASFDHPYIVNRLARLGLQNPFHGTDVFDLLEAYKRLYKRKSYRLKAVALEEGLITDEVARITYSPTMSINELVEYNKRDVEIMVKLDEKYHLVDFYTTLKEYVGVPHLEDTFSNSILIDTELLRIARERGIVMPSVAESSEEGYEGAIVLEPPAGIYENIAVFDMTAYYPSIIMSFNISPDTLVVGVTGGDVIKYNSVAFKKAPTGLLPEVCHRFLMIRRQLEDKLKTLTPGSREYNLLKVKRDAVKYLVNAVYGYTGFNKSRVFDIRIASTITAIGREGILKAKELAEAKGFKVLYGDTDSIMIQVPFDKAQELVDYLNEEIRKYFKEKYNVPNVQIGLKFEIYADKVLFFGVKKRYVAHVIWEKGKQADYFKYVGIEAVRSDEPKFAQEFQKGLIELVLRETVHGRISVDKVMDYINKKREELRKAQHIDIALSDGLNKPLDKYKVKPPHVRAVLYSNTYLGTNFKHGDRIYWVWVKGVKGYPSTDVVAFDVDTKLPELIIDWAKMEEVNIWQKAQPVLEVLGLSTNRGSLSTLKKWFC